MFRGAVRRAWRIGLAAACAWLGAGSAGAAAADPAEGSAEDGAAVVDFDDAILRERGLDPGLARRFREARGFDAGEQPVQFTLNGSTLGQRRARFDRQGRLCFDPALVQVLGLLPMDGSQGPADLPPADRPAASAGAPPVAPADAAAGSCPDYRSFAPRALVQLQPALGSVEITVPAAYLAPGPRTTRHEGGGIGGLLNYRAFATATQPGGDAGVSSRYRYVDSVAGFNAGGWMFRSRQDYVAGGQDARLRWRAAFAQRSFEAQKQMLQVGRVVSQDPLFAGVSVEGLQWFPEPLLLAQGAGYAVTGLAATRARVEISQNGVPLLNTLVPPGPFSLTDYRLANPSADLQVRVVEEGGSEQRFTVPASSLLLARTGAQNRGWNLAAGRFWDQSGRGQIRQAPLLQASRGWAEGPLSGSVGGQLAAGYAAAGATLGAALAERRSSLYAQLLAAQDRRHGQAGLYASAAAGTELGDGLRAGLSGNLRSRRYRSLSEALTERSDALAWNFAGYRSQLGATVAWSAGDWGGFSAALTRQDYFAGDAGYIASLNWNRSWRGGISLNIGMSHRTARLTPADTGDGLPGTARLAGGNYVYASVSIPLGSGASVRADYQHSERGSRLGSTYEQRVNEFFGWRASAEQNRGGSAPGPGGSLSAYGTPYFVSLTGGINRSRDTSAYYGEASGGVVATGDGIAFSPYAVQDSFGTLRTGDVRGARLETPQGPAWSGWNGLVALPGLQPWQDTRLEVGGTSLPLDVEVDQGLQVVQAARGAVLQLSMPMRRVSRLLLVVTLADGQPLPLGSAVLRGDDDYFTAAAAGGRVLVTQDGAGLPLRAELADGRRCTIVEVQAEPRRPDQPFARGSARCL